MRGVLQFHVALSTTLLCAGEICLGRFEAGVPRSRRLLKAALFLGITALLSARWGHAAALGWVLFAAAAGLGVHAGWTRRHGIGLREPEPWDRYRELRGLRRPGDAA